MGKYDDEIVVLCSVLMFDRKYNGKKQNRYSKSTGMLLYRNKSSKFILVLFSLEVVIMYLSKMSNNE